MNSILGFTDVLRRGFAADEQTRQHYLDTIHSSGKHLLELINDILDLSKIEAGRLEIERKACSPCELISELRGHVHRARAKPGDLPGVQHGRSGPRDDPHRSDPAPADRRQPRRQRDQVHRDRRRENRRPAPAACPRNPSWRST